jgi:hypothetical protein
VVDAEREYRGPDLFDQQLVSAQLLVSRLIRGRMTARLAATSAWFARRNGISGGGVTWHVIWNKGFLPRRAGYWVFEWT